jgi:phosphotransferase system  glucose/maltose/N-acetylglucosamine-specific IIC component
VETLAASEGWLRKPAIYSPQALLGFSALVNPLMGGLLAYQSLRQLGQAAAAWSALCASCNFWIFTLLVSSSLRWGGIFGVGLGYVWGHWLNRYISRKLPDATSYPPKSVLVPVIVSLLLGVVLLGIKQSLR